MSDLDDLLDYGSDLEPGTTGAGQQQASEGTVHEDADASISGSDPGSPAASHPSEKGPTFGNAKLAYDERFDSSRFSPRIQS